MRHSPPLPVVIETSAALQRLPAHGTVEVQRPTGDVTVYVVERLLGRGSTGWACVARDPAGQSVVVKIALALGDSHEQRVRNEAQVYAELDGTPELPRFHGLGIDDRRHPALVVDFVPGVPIRSTEATRESPGLSVRIVGQVLKAVAALNEHGRSHRDLAPSNILMQGDAPETLKVFDLGMAVPFSAPYEYGGPKYYAPEQTAAQPSEGRMNGDVYSAGAHLLELLTGLEPTPANQAQALKLVPNRTVTKGKRKVSLRQIVKRALAADPAQRLQSAREMLQLLEPFASR